MKEVFIDSLMEILREQRDAGYDTVDIDQLHEYFDPAHERQAGHRWLPDEASEPLIWLNENEGEAKTDDGRVRLVRNYKGGGPAVFLKEV